MKALFYSIFFFLLIASSFGDDMDAFTRALDAKSTLDPTERSYEDKAKKDGIKPIELTLEKVFYLIESENLTVLLNREKIQEALQQAYIKRADLLPQVSLNLEQLRFRLVNSIGTEGRKLVSFQANRFDGTLDGTLAVFDLNKIAGYQAAKMGFKISELNYHAILQDILTEAGKLYYLHIRNLKALDVTDANLAEAKALYDLAKARFDAGVSSPIDVTKAEVQIAIYKRDRISQEVIIKASELELKRMLDICYDLPIEVSYVSSDKARPEPHLEKPPLCDVYQNRYDYLTACNQLQLNKYLKRAAAWAAYPVVNAIADWGYASRLPLNGNSMEEWTIGLTLSMPIFDGFRIRSNVLKQDSLVRQQTDTVLDVMNTINTQYALNEYTLKARYDQIDLIRQQVKLGEEELELAKTRFKEGVADNTDIVTAQNNLATFMDNLVNILYLYDVSRLDWARTLGDVRRILCDAN